MKFLAFAVFVSTLCWIQAVYAEDCSQAIIAPDGSKYDLSGIGWRTQTYELAAPDYTYSYNISICNPLADPCSNQQCGSPSTAAICQYWGNTINQEKCFGKAATRTIVGLNKGAGVQITFTNGDICGSCNPIQPRESTVTLLCNSSLRDRTQIYWDVADVPQPNGPAVANFIGSFVC